MKGLTKLLIFIAVSVILVVLYHFLIHTKSSKEIKKFKETYSIVSDSLSQARLIANRLPETQREYNFLKKQWVVAKGMLPSEKITEQLLSIISKAATQNNIKVLSFKPEKLTASKVSSKQNLQEYPLSIKILGSYHHTGRFFSDIGNLKRIIRIANVKMTGKKEKGIETVFTATSYIYSGVVEKKSKKEVKKPKK